MFSANIREKLMNLLKKGEIDSFFKQLDTYANNSLYEHPVSEIREEWRKLQVASRNHLMDDEQVRLALIAYFRKKSEYMLQLKEGE